VPRRDRSLDSAVYRRDRWQCQVPECLHPDGRAINPRLRGKDDPWAPSVDHVIPQVGGGADSMENLRAAHRWCNQARERHRRRP
jgi:5-methylcytosine-specific restriction endonuclease McrA